jgi:hypothetical protein
MSSVVIPQLVQVQSGCRDGVTLVPGAITAGYCEMGEYRFIMPGPDWQLVIDDEPIAMADGSWRWNPGFYAGLVQAELFDPAGVSRSGFQLDVAPDARKVGADIFNGMLDDIWNFEPELVLGTEPAQHAIGSSGSVRSPWLEYARLRAWAPLFLRALATIARQPLRDLKATRAQVPAYAMRSADRATVMARIRNPQTLLMGNAGIALGEDGTHVLFDVPVVREDLDSAANRCLAAVVRNATWRVVQLLDALEKEVEGEAPSDTRTSLAARWPRRREILMQLHQRLLRVQRTEPLRSVSRPEVSAAGLTAISADPSYSAAYRLGWKMLRPGIDGVDPDERAWLSPTWAIYENWCFVEIAKWLHTRVSNLTRVSTRSVGVTATFALAGTDKAGNQFQLLLQPRFPAADQAANAGFHSISGQRFPDIVLTRVADDKAVCIVLDAKYRTQRPQVLDAMTSAHIYRDSLRFQDRPVDVALLLVPRGGGAPWLEDSGFQTNNRVGAVQLSPDSESTALDAALNRSWLL